MNEQLRKAIEDATGMWTWTDKEMGMRVVKESDCLESEAKLLRVIEMLVKQRDCFIEENYWLDTERLDAELIAALEGEKDEMSLCPIDPNGNPEGRTGGTGWD